MYSGRLILYVFSYAFVRKLRCTLSEVDHEDRKKALRNVSEMGSGVKVTTSGMYVGAWLCSYTRTVQET
jgi:hypothetical protein